MERAQITKALDDAFTAHVTLLFSNLCIANSDEGRDRFNAGIKIAIQARDKAVATYGAMS